MRRRSPAPEIRDVVRWLVEYREENGFPPSRRETSERFGMSLSSTQRVLDDLIREGLVEVRPFIPRGINITGAGMKLARDPMEEFS